jgi:hypothetical protein
MNDALLIQHATNCHSGKMLALTYARHTDYCAAHNFDYWALSGRYPVAAMESPWIKMSLVKWAAMMDYKYIVWMDLDAVILDMNADLRDACVKPANMVIWPHPAPYLQAGVIYYNNTDYKAYELAARCVAERSGYRHEQDQLNEMAMKQPELFSSLDIKWNWGEHCGVPCAAPVVRAWHLIDFRVKFELMKKELTV